jgi:hypothetical protein
VDNIAIQPAATSATWTYNAPDSRACSVDVSSAAAGADGAWNRVTDKGGSTARTLTVGDLAPDADYRWRLICYFDQSRTYDLWKPGQITSGTFHTDMRR